MYEYPQLNVNMRYVTFQRMKGIATLLKKKYNLLMKERRFLNIILVLVYVLSSIAITQKYVLYVLVHKVIGITWTSNKEYYYVISYYCHCVDLLQVGACQNLLPNSEHLGWKVGAGGELKSGSSIHCNRKAAIVCSWKYRMGHSVLVRPRRSLEAV